MLKSFLAQEDGPSSPHGSSGSGGMAEQSGKQDHSELLSQLNQHFGDVLAQPLGGAPQTLPLPPHGEGHTSPHSHSEASGLTGRSRGSAGTNIFPSMDESISAAGAGSSGLFTGGGGGLV